MEQHASEGDAARARRRAEAAAEMRRCDLEAETEQAERRLAQARAAELRAEFESRRLWDFEFRRRYDRAHPRSGCDCPGHTAWRAWRRKD
jgi:hypothetical protein